MKADREIKVRCSACGHLTRIPTVTNADRIRSMTDEELAEWYFVKFYPTVPYCRADECPADGRRGCIECLAEWLKQESEGE